MKENRSKFAIEKMCKVFNVSRSGYYDAVNRTLSFNALSTLKVKKMIKCIYDKSKGRYGSPKITKQLRSMGVKISRPRVA